MFLHSAPETVHKGIAQRTQRTETSSASTKIELQVYVTE